MPRGDKTSYTGKQQRQAEHIEEGYEKRGASKLEAERRAWATVNKETGGGKKSGSGRGKKTSTASSKKGGKIGGKATSILKSANGTAKKSKVRSTTKTKSTTVRKPAAKAVKKAAPRKGSTTATKRK